MPTATVCALLLSQTTTIALTGDIMLNGISPKRSPLAAMAPVIGGADVALGNLEIPLTSHRSPTRRKSAAELKKRSQFILKAEPKHADGLAAAGFDLVSLANNHAMDYGAAGLQEEMAELDRRGIAHAGAGRTAREATALTVVTAKTGLRIGLLSALAFAGAPALRKTTPATTTTPGISVLSFGGRINDVARAKLGRWVGRARAECDFLIVAVHWGTERKPVPNSYQLELGRAISTAGADLVWGHHPHVLQGWEKTSGGVPILYSMGNFVSPTPAVSAVALLTVEPHRVTSLKFRGIKIRGGVTTLMKAADEAALLREIKRRSRLIPRPKAAKT